MRTIAFVLWLESYLKFCSVGLVDSSRIVCYVVADPYINITALNLIIKIIK
jgi:hypothetical protein